MIHEIRGISPGIISTRNLARACIACESQSGDWENISTVGIWEAKYLRDGRGITSRGSVRTRGGDTTRGIVDTRGGDTTRGRVDTRGRDRTRGGDRTREAVTTRGRVRNRRGDRTETRDGRKKEQNPLKKVSLLEFQT